jgi:hypothetical protein
VKMRCERGGKSRGGSTVSLLKQFTILLMLLLFLTCIAQAGDWPMFHHDLRHTGYTDEKIPDELELLWSYETGDSFSSPVIANGKVLAPSITYLVIMN